MAPGGRCGKKLPCGDSCKEKNTSGHMCTCSLKWTLDPGCVHMMAGTCSKSLLEAMTKGCFEICGRSLECGHPCLQACSDACVCNNPECDIDTNHRDERSILVEDLQNGSTFGFKIQPGPRVVAANPSQPSTSSGSTNENANTDFWSDFDKLEGQPVEQMSSQHMEQIRKLLPSSAFDKSVKSPWHEIYFFTQCPNAHVFSLDDELCPVCDSLPVGPNITLIKKGVPMESNPDNNSAEAEQSHEMPIGVDDLEVEA